MNLVIGLAYKYFGEKTLTELFVRWQGDSRQQMLDDLAWLYIEQIVYKLEIPIKTGPGRGAGWITQKLFLQESISCHGRNG